MADLENIKERIRKLLALANNAGATPDEAALAASKAAELALEYGLELDKLQGQQPGMDKLPFGWHLIDDEYWNAERWENSLLLNICEANGCRFVWSKSVHGMRPCAAGRESAIPVIRMTVAYVIESMKRTQRKYISEQNLGSPKARKEHRYAYRVGYISVVCNRIKAWVDQGLSGKNALVVYRGDQLNAVDRWIASQTTTQIQSWQPKDKNIDAAAFRAGQKDGEAVSLNRQVGNESKKEHPQLSN